MPTDYDHPSGAGQDADARYSRIFSPLAAAADAAAQCLADRLDELELDVAPGDPWNVRLKKARIKKGLSKKQAAAELLKASKDPSAKTSWETVKQHELGHMPRPATRRAYAAVYGVSQRVLFPAAE